jgi:signal recognition particle receptor subunit beta
MPSVSHGAHEVHLKIVYYGPGLGGKTTNLEHIHRHSRPERRGKLISITTEAERTLFFDLLPMELGAFKGYTVRLHLCTVPGQIAQDATRRLVLRHVDGVVFVVDSQPDRLDDNIESAKNLDVNLRLQGDDPERVPLVVQYNKRDLPGVVPVDRLAMLLDVPPGVPQYEAAARHGWGVFETLKRITTDCLKLVGEPAQAIEGRSPSIVPGQRSSMFPDARPPVIDTAPDVVLPPAAGVPLDDEV